MPTRLLVAAGIVVLLTVAGHRPARAAAAETGRALRAWWAVAGVWHAVALAAIVAVGVALRLHYLRGPMRWDESYTFISYASRGLKDGLSLYDAPNNHVFHTLLMHLSYGRLGIGESALRAPVFLAGALIAPVAYAAAAQLYGRQAALLSAALCAASAQLVEYATNARGYSIAALFATALLALAPRLLRSTNPVWWALWALTTALGLYTVPVFAYPYGVVAGALAVAALLGYTTQRPLAFLARVAGTTVAAVAFAALLYGPILGDVLRYISEGGYSDDPWGIVGQTWTLWKLGLPDFVAWLLLAAFAVSAASIGRHSRRPLPLGAMFVAFALTVIALGRVVPFTRVFLPLLPLFLVAASGAALGFTPVRKLFERRALDRGLSVVVVSVAVALAVHVSDARLADSDGSALPSAGHIAEAVAPLLKGSGDRVVMDASANPILRYEFMRHGFSPGVIVPEATPDLLRGGRIYLVVNEGAGNTLASTLSGMPAIAADRPPAREVAHFRGARLYLLGRG
jgi:hypothetical protein